MSDLYNDFNAFAYEAITVGGAAIGLSPAVYAAAGSIIAQKAYITTETQSIRYRLDGGDPTTTEGHLLAAPGELTLRGYTNIKNFRMIAVTPSAAVKVSYSR